MTDEETRIKALEMALMYFAALPDSEKQKRWDEYTDFELSDKEYFDSLGDIFHMMVVNLRSIDSLFENEKY